VEGNGLDEDTLESAGAEEAETLVAATTNSEVNALAAHLARDAFGVTRALPVLGHPSRGAGPRLVDRVGGRMAFAHPVDVREWEYALEHGEARVVTYLAPLDWAGRSLHAIAIPREVVILARAQGKSIEVAHSELTWRRDDEAMVLTRLSEEETGRMLDAVSPATVRAGS
jgi:Trk K+ transport system NAD-binding subunit